jgi:hypothetical protein
MDVGKLFTFLVLVALAAIGVLEWLKALLSDRKVPAWLWTALSGIICLVAGVGSVLGGMFQDFFTLPTTLLGIASGAVVGLIALAFVETCYQQLYKLLSAFVAWLIERLSGPKGPTPGAS